MKDVLSDEIRVMLRPVATYRHMAGETAGGGFRLLLNRPLFFLLMVAATVSFTTSGQLIAPLVLGSAIVWSFAPVLQILVVSGFVSVVARDRLNIFRAVDLFFAGFWPWLFWMLCVAGGCLLIPLEQVELSPVRIEWVMVGFLGAFIWSSVTCYGFYRGALKLSALRAALVALLHIGLVWGITISYFLIIEVIEPYLLSWF